MRWFNHQTNITVEFALKNDTECIYILVNHQIDIIIEFALKNGVECIYIFANSQNYQNRLVQLLNGHRN
jgi:DUF2075 family protein